MKTLKISFLLLAFISCTTHIPHDNAETDTDFPTEEEVIISPQISNQRISGIAEDADGYIWISTFRGLNRYNGHDYHQYYRTDDETSLPDNQLNAVFKDSKNRLWVASINGAAYYTDQDNFHRVKMEGLSSENGTQFVENSKGKLFLNLVNSFAIFDEEKDAFTHEVFRHEPMDAYTMKLYIDKQDRLWEVCGWSIKNFDSNTLALGDSIQLDQFMAISCMQGDNIWMYGNGSFRIFNTTSKTFLPVPESITQNALLKTSTVDCIYPTTQNVLEFFTRNGIFIYNTKDQQLRHQSEVGFPLSNEEFHPNSAYTDSKGNIWLGSYTQGIFVRNIEKKTFNSGSSISAILANKAVSAVTTDSKGNLWVATANYGIYQFNEKFFLMNHFDLGNFFPDKKMGEYDASVLYFDREGFLWVAFNQSIAKFRYDEKGLTLIKEYPSFWPLTIFQDKNLTLWVGTYSPLLFTLPKGADQFQTQTVDQGFSYTSVIKELQNGENVALTWKNGVMGLDVENYKLGKSLVNSESMQLAVKRNLFLPSCLLEDSKGRVWIGTVSNGLMEYHPDTQKMEAVQGIYCSDICSIEEDQDGNLWISTMNGLSKFDPETRQFSSYDTSDGIGGNQFVDRASCKLNNGTLVFGGNHGLTIFDPAETKKERHIPILFEDLKVHNNLVHPGEGTCIDKKLSCKPEIHLNHTQNGFSLSFVALDYVQDNKANYHYKLEGFDKYWIEAQNTHEAYYANIKPGCYTFKVKVTSNDGKQIEGENEIQIKVTPAPWLTWWAKTIYLLIAFGILYLLFRSYNRTQITKREALQAEREKEHELYVNKMNMNFFANVSHEFRTPLTIISGPIEQLCADTTIEGETKHLLFIVQRSVRRMLRLVNQMMDFHKLENDTLKLQVEKCDISNLLHQVSDLFTITANEKDIQLNIYGLEEKYHMWIDVDKIEKITTNLLSNAFKFTPSGGKVVLSFDVITRGEAAQQYPLTAKDIDTQYVKISVKDTGRGIPSTELEHVFERYFQLDNNQLGNYQWGSGIGLYYAKALVQLHHGYIKAENRKDQQSGTIFSYILPASETSYTAEEHATQLDQNLHFPLQQQVNSTLEENDESDNRKRILVVDDDSEVVHYLKTLLSGDYHIITRFDAEAGLKAMQEEEPDLVISDVLMPGINGYEFCKQIKENIQLCHIPVILVTAKTTTENQIEGLNSGADAYVIKPFDPAYLKALIHSLFQNRERARNILNKSTQTTELPEEVLSPQDKNFMDELYNIMEKELNNPELDVTYMTEKLRISRTKLYYKIKGLTGENPSVFFRRYKLNRAAELIKEGKYNLSEIADMTGFTTLSHFSTSFKKQFGMAPSEYK